MKVALLIDGGHLRAIARKAGYRYNPDFIDLFAHSCADEEAGERLLRIMYYDAPQYRGRHRLPVSGGWHGFKASDAWLADLAGRDMFAVRKGTIGFRGWSLKRTPDALRKRLERGEGLADSDFIPSFEQKGVDMRIGLDIATFASERSVERVILVSADSDMIPAMKHARKAGLQVVVTQLPCPPARPQRPELRAHADFTRAVAWPAGAVNAPAEVIDELIIDEEDSA